MSRPRCHNLLNCHLITISLCLRYVEKHFLFLSVSEVSLVTGLFERHDYLRGLQAVLELVLGDEKEPGDIGLLGPYLLL